MRVTQATVGVRSDSFAAASYQSSKLSLDISVRFATVTLRGNLYDRSLVIDSFLQALLTLLSFKTPTNTRPIAQIVSCLLIDSSSILVSQLVKRTDFLPNAFLDAAGREIQKMSYLGAFFDKSLATDDMEVSGFFLRR